MDVYRVRGGARLSGSVSVAGAKNSALKLMAAALLAPGRSRLENVPQILDVTIMTEVLRRLGCAVSADGDVVEIDVPERTTTETDYQLVRRMRAAVAVLGPLVARFGHAKVALPGGDAIGARGLDMHIDGLQRLGADVRLEHGYLIATASRLRGTEVTFDFPSVGATENVLMASVLADGETVIDNAAREPEIVDLVDMLRSMGAVIEGEGTSTLRVQGTDGLSATRHRTVPDRIVAGTWAIGAAMTRGDVRVHDARADHIERVLQRLGDMGADVSTYDDGFRVQMDARPTAHDIVTLPYPGFPTDLQPMAIALNAIAHGHSILTENVFEGRFRFVNELIRLGAHITIDGHHCSIHGTERFSSAPVEATDIRAGAGLVLAALVADGVTEVGHVHHIDRGYPGFEEQLRALGATIERVTVPQVDPSE
ncbi:MAG: UDP-N-acetylglucosamine 1-carboxyvinyltransferase [Cumulibacter sp.]